MIKQMRRIGAAFFVLVTAVSTACNVLEPNELRGDLITVVNRTSEPLYFLATNATVASRLDAVFTRPIDPDSDQIVPPGGAVDLTSHSIWGFEPGDDLVLFLYHVKDGEATNRGFLRFTNDELRDKGYRVTVDALPFP